MTETARVGPGKPDNSKLKGCLGIVVFFVAFFTIVPFLASGVLWEYFFPYEEQQLKMVLTDARVTSMTQSRQQYTYYLDNNETESYSFNGYVRATAADRKRFIEDYGYNTSNLGHYLGLHDRLTKAANSPLIMVHRGSIVTHWILYSATPESKVPPPKRYVVMNGDTIIERELSELFWSK